MRIRHGAAAVVTATLAIADVARADFIEPVTIDTGVASIHDIAVAPDGTGALVYLKTVGADAQVWASTLAAGTWGAPVRVDPDNGDDESAPRVAVANRGRVLVGYRDGVGRVLKYRLKPAAPAPFGGEQLMRDAGSTNAIHADWDLDMNPAGVAYAAWAEEGGLERHARAWRLEGTTASPLPLALQKNPGTESVHGTDAGGPHIRVGIDDAGNGTIVFGQTEGSGESVYLRRLSGVVPGPFVDLPSAFDGARELDLDVAGDGLAWIAGVADDRGAGVPVTGETAGALAVLDAYPVVETDEVVRPDVALNATGRGLFASEPNTKPGAFGGSISGATASPAQRLDTSPHVTAAEIPAAAISDNGRGLIAWMRRPPSGPFQIVARVWNGSGFEPERPMIDDALMSPTMAPADGAAASRLGDVAVLAERVVLSNRHAVVGRYDAPPSAPTVTSAPHASTFTWSPSEAIWSPLTGYKVVIDGTTVAMLGTDARSYTASGLAPGAHSWRIVAVDELRQEAASATQTLTIPGGGGPGGGNPPPAADTTPPLISGLTQSRKRWRIRQGTTFRLTLSEPATLTIEFRKRVPGRRVKGRCVKPKRSLRNRPRCIRAVRQGTATRSAQGGAASIRFTGRMDGGKRLKPGKYEAVLRARDGAGNVSKPARLRFTVRR